VKRVVAFVAILFTLLGRKEEATFVVAKQNNKAKVVIFGASRLCMVLEERKGNGEGKILQVFEKEIPFLC